jgi:hypothetical protein
MHVFVIREYEEFSGGRVLLPLQKLVERLSFVEVLFWCLREITMACSSSFFGIAIPDVEKLSRHLSRGIGLANTDFEAFLHTDFQVIDGYVEGYAGTSREPLLRIECVDSAQWEVSTDSDGIASELARRGFSRK